MMQPTSAKKCREQTMTEINPESFKKRSSLYSKTIDAEFVEVSEAALANNFFANKRQLAKAGLLDLSVLPRGGIRGLAASEFLADNHWPIPEKPNKALETKEGDLVLRLSQKEFWLLSNPLSQGETIDNFVAQPLPDKDCYSLFCQDSHCWLMMTGEHLPQIMAKVCGVDLRSDVFMIGSIAQTVTARVNTIIVHHQINQIPCFSILCDAAAGEYMWDSLLDAMQEFGGKPVGVSNFV